MTGARISWPATLAKKLASLSGNVGMSAEHLSWLFSGAEIERLATTLRQYFDAIEVIVYIRRQDKQAISHHQQGRDPRGWPDRSTILEIAVLFRMEERIMMNTSITVRDWACGEIPLVWSRSLFEYSNLRS